MHWTQLLLIVLLTIVITIAGTYWVLKTYVFTTSFTPVSLSEKEAETLQAKLNTLGYESAPSSDHRFTKHLDQEQNNEIDENGFLKPEPYSEENKPREISFTERELNALLAKNTELAQKLAIDLGEGLISAKLLIPLEEDFPLLGGKTLRFSAGVGMAYQNKKPVIVIKGASIMGVPMPNAWLGGLKNIDLINEFGIDPGFWNSFADGVKDIHVTDGQVNIKLQE